jgi:hypothetical protein
MGDPQTASGRFIEIRDCPGGEIGEKATGLVPPKPGLHIQKAHKQYFDYLQKLAYSEFPAQGQVFNTSLFLPLLASGLPL